jgi:putative ATP-dependent endonuclease of the OLD family
MSRGGGAVLASIQQTVNSLLGVSIDAFAGPVSDRPSVLRPRASGPSAELDVDDFLVQVNGSGVREALRLVLDVEFERPHILLVEEPEIHLHPALEIAMMRYLRSVSADTQVFVTTHSTNFLDTTDIQTVYLVSKAAATVVERLSLTDMDTSISRELGIRLSSVFMYDKLVFVEGTTDELVLRELAAKIGVNLSQPTPVSS